MLMAPLALVSGDAGDAPSDAALVARARAGDRSATASLYARHVERVRRIVARIVGVGPELDDLVQDAFVAAFRRLSSLRDASAFGPWLDAVSVGEARHHLRAQARRRWLSFRAPSDVPDVAAPSLLDPARDAAKAATSILSSMPTDLRIAFSLRRVDGRSLEEAASMCRVSLATFKRRMQRADAFFQERARDHAALAHYFSETTT